MLTNRLESMVWAQLLNTAFIFYVTPILLHILGGPNVSLRSNIHFLSMDCIVENDTINSKGPVLTLHKAFLKRIVFDPVNIWISPLILLRHGLAFLWRSVKWLSSNVLTVFFFSSSPFIGLAVSLQLLHGDIEQIRRDYASMFTHGVSITRKLGFSNIIMPGKCKAAGRKTLT